MKEYNYSIIDKGRYLRDWFVYGSCKIQETGLNCSKEFFTAKLLSCVYMFDCCMYFFAAFPKRYMRIKTNTIQCGLGIRCRRA